jgi:hypothetical protein
MVEIRDTLSYQGRGHLVLGMTPMSVTPRLIEIEDTDNGRIRSVSPDELLRLPVGAKRPSANRGSAAAKSGDRRLQD